MKGSIAQPESCDIPCLAKTKANAEESICKFNRKGLAAASATAKRCVTLLFLNARSEMEKDFRNITDAFVRNGEKDKQQRSRHC